MDEDVRGRRDDDRLGGGAGNDRQVGGEGADIFVVSADRDVVLDFTAGEHLLDLSGVVGIEAFDDVWDAVRERGNGLVLNLDEGRLVLKGAEFAALGADDALL